MQNGCCMTDGRWWTKNEWAIIIMANDFIKQQVGDDLDYVDGMPEETGCACDSIAVDTDDSADWLDAAEQDVYKSRIK